MASAARVTASGLARPPGRGAGGPGGRPGRGAGSPGGSPGGRPGRGEGRPGRGARWEGTRTTLVTYCPACARLAPGDNPASTPRPAHPHYWGAGLATVRTEGLASPVPPVNLSKIFSG